MTEDRHGLRAWLSNPVDIAWLCAFRALFGAVMAFSMFRLLAYGWIDAFFVAPTFHFKYWGWAWVEPLPRAGMHVLVLALLVLALLFAAGIAFRFCAWAFGAGFLYLQLVDVTNYLNHYYLATWLVFLLALSPAARNYRLGGHAQKLSKIPAYWLHILRFQVGVVYTFAGLAKAHVDWLVHAQPLGIWLSSHTDFPLIGPLLRSESAAPVMSWAGFVFDTSIPWLLSWRALRPWAYLAVCGFHLLTGLLFPIGMFPVIMVLSASVFFSPEWPHALWATLVRPVGHDLLPGPMSAPKIVQSEVPNYAVALFVGYVALHVLVPLRFLAYGGDVLWHEQGMRFSWRVMVREKNGSVTYHVHQPSTGRRWYVSPSTYLTGLQEREMSGQPDLILQLAHHIRDDYAQRGFGMVEVRAEASASLNGRKSQPLIDPRADLARVRDGIGKASWILPAPDAPPPRLRRI